MEEWRDVKGYEGLYQVSNLGRVKSLSIVDRIGRIKTGKIKDTCDNGRGYLQVNLKHDGVQKQSTVHKLVAEAFIPNPDNLPEINHIDGDKANNNVNNLEWCTRSGNLSHAFKTGLNKQLKGINNPHATLTKEDVVFIRNNYKAYDKELGSEALARKYGVSSTTIKMALWRKTYVDVL